MGTSVGESDWVDVADDGNWVDVPESKTPSVWDAARGIVETGAFGLADAGTTIARSLNRFGEWGNRQLDAAFPQTMAAIDSVKPDLGAYALPSDQEYADFSNQIRQAYGDINQESSPESGVGKYAYRALSGLARLAPKLSLSIPGFAAASGLEGGLGRYYGETDQGVAPEVAGPYAAAGGTLDAVTGLAIPAAMKYFPGWTPGALAGETAVLGGSGAAQTGLEALLRKYMLGDQNATNDVGQHMLDSVYEAPFMTAGIRAGGAVASRFSRERPSQMQQFREQIAKDVPPPPEFIPRPEAMSGAYASSAPETARPVDLNQRASSQAYAAQDVSPDKVALDAILAKWNSEVAAREQRLSDQSRVDASRLEQMQSLPEPLIIGGIAEATPSKIIVPESPGSGPRTEAVTQALAAELKGGTEIYNTKRGWMPKAPEETVVDPMATQAKAMLESKVKPELPPLPKKINLDKEMSENSFASPAEIATKFETKVAQPETVAPPAETIAPQVETKPTLPEMPIAREPTSIVGDIPTVEAPIERLSLSKDVPNFKSGAKDNGVVEPLKGKFDRRGVAPIAVWERNNGNLEVITGRHRFDLAKRSGEKSIPAQVFKESEGFTKEDALILDAELNIRDEQGSVTDYAQYFRARQPSAQEAEARGLLSRSKGKAGFSIGTKASDELYALHQSRKLSDSQAEAIANAAPGNPDLQRAGIDAALKNNAPAQELANIIDDLRGVQVSGEQQGDLFGANNSYINAAVAKSRLARTHQRELAKQIKSAEGAAENPKEAAKFDVNVKDQAAALQKLADLKRERDRWAEWGKHDDLREQLKTELASKPRQQNLEGGFFRPGDAIEAIKDTIANFIPEGRKKLEKEFPGAKREEVPSIEKFFEGRTFGADIPLVSQSRAAYRRSFIYPKTLSEKSPEFKPIFNTAMKLEAQRDSIAFALSEKMKDYTLLRDKARVNDYLAATRIEAQEGRNIVETPETLAAKGLSPEEVKAVLAWRDTANASLDVVRDTLIKDGKDATEAQDVVDSLKTQMFVPFGRFGDKFVYSAEANGGKGHFSLHDNESGIRQALSDLSKQGVKDARFGQFKKPPREAYEDIPLSLASHIGEIPAESSNGALPPQGFRAHLTPAKLTPGFEKNLDRSISEYIMGLSNWAAKKQAKPEFATALAGIDSTRNGNLFAYSKRYIDYMTKNTPEMQKLRNAMSLYYLGGGVKSAAVNLTQSITTTFHLIAKEVGYTRAPAVYADAMKKSLWYFMNPKGFAKANPELNEVLRNAYSHGKISAENWRQLTGRIHNSSVKKSPLDYSMIMFDAAEQLNRTHAIISGAEMAKAKGANIEEQVQRGEGLSNDSQFILGKANRPQVARGAKAPFFLFKQFQGNWLRLLRNNLNRKDWPYAAGMMGTMLALGGVVAVPGGAALIKLFETAGADPKRKMREMGAGTGTLYGAPAKYLGMDFSGSLQVGELPDFSKGVFPGLFNFGLGVPAALAQKFGKSIWLAKDMDNPKRALETALPPGFGGTYMTGERWAQEGVRSPYGDAILAKEDLTPGEIWRKKYLGIQPTKVTEAYEKQNSLKILGDAAKNNDNINFKLAQAIVNRDEKRKAELIAEAKDKKIRIDLDTVKAKIKQMKAPPLISQVKKLPKKARREGMETVRGY